MREKISPFIQKLSSNHFIRDQYFISDKENIAIAHNDPLMEDKHEVVKGLIHKYSNRALIKVSYQCAAHCRFCTRVRQIGNPEGTLTDKNIEDIIFYLKQNSCIDDVILSGGDPLYTPQITTKLLQGLQTITSIKTIRIGTRLPFHSPDSFRTKSIKDLLALIDTIGKSMPVFMLVHIEHPDELTGETEAVIRQLRQLKITVLSQTVFLKDINDNFETLYLLFKKLYHLGIIPYYLYHCDNVKGLEHFRGDIKKEKEIAVRLRSELSGIGCPLFVEDIEDGYGKIPVI